MIEYAIYYNKEGETLETVCCASDIMNAISVVWSQQDVELSEITQIRQI